MSDDPLCFTVLRGRIEIGPHGGPKLSLDTIPRAIRALIDSGSMDENDTIEWYRRAERLMQKIRNGFVDADVTCFLPESKT